MSVLIDTHFLIWLVSGADRLAKYPWLETYRPWWVSPVSLLEVQFLDEVGRLEVRNPEFTDKVMADPRFVVDEIGLASLVRRALPLDWTRDPFDRLLAAHSLARMTALCTTDRTLRQHHPLLVPELAKLG